MLTVDYLENILKSKVTVVKDHVTTNKQVELPYVVILEMSSENIFADNRTYMEIIPMQVILHQAHRDSTLEETIKGVFNDNHIPYEVDTEWDRNNLLYATTFDING